MVAIKGNQTQTVAQLFAIGMAVLAEAKAKKTRAEVQKCNDDLLAEYMKAKPATFDDLSKAILADGQSDPKWPIVDGAKVGYQKAIKEGSVGAAGYNSFRAWCAKWVNPETLAKITPEELKAAKEEKEAASQGEKQAAEALDVIGGIPTATLIAELRKRRDAGDAEAKSLKFPKVA